MIHRLFIGLAAACLLAAGAARAQSGQAAAGRPCEATEQTIGIGPQRNEAPAGEESLVAYDVALTGFADYEHDVDVVFVDAAGEETQPAGLSMEGIEGAPTDKTLTLRVTAEAKAGDYAFALRVNGVRSAADGRLVVGGAIEEEALTAADEASGLRVQVRYAFGGRFAAGTRLKLGVQPTGEDEAALTLKIVDAHGADAQLSDRLYVEIALPAGWPDAEAALAGPDGQQKSLHTAGGDGSISFVLEQAETVRLLKKGVKAEK